MKIQDIQARVEAPWLTPALRAALERAGFGSVLEAARALKKGCLPAGLASFEEAIRRGGDAVGNTMRDLLAGQDPAGFTIAQRDEGGPATSFATVDATEYVDPDSMQSRLSAAKYLSELYATLNTGITAREGFGLEARRPDLKKLPLSQDCFDKKISKRALVLEVLRDRASEVSGAGSLDALYRNMAAATHRRARHR